MRKKSDIAADSLAHSTHLDEIPTLFRAWLPSGTVHVSLPDLPTYIDIYASVEDVEPDSTTIAAINETRSQ